MAMLAYVAHPIGDGEAADDERRGDNIANAGDWIRFFTDITRWTCLAPWHTWAITHGESIYAPRRLMDQISALERCDLLVMVGGFVSPHMNYELQAAKRAGIPVADLTLFVVSPPEQTDEDAVTSILARVKRSINRVPRRVWLPLFTERDIYEMKELTHAVAAHLPGEHNNAVGLLTRIVEAAIELGDPSDPNLMGPARTKTR